MSDPWESKMEISVQKPNFNVSLRAAVFALVVVCVLPVGFAQAARAQTYTVIYNFTVSGGVLPAAGLTIDAAGNLYGTTTQSSYYGSVFKLSHRGSGWVFTPLYLFQGGDDGAAPIARVVFGPDGSLYGTTEDGGGLCSGPGCGTVFKLRPPAAACKTALCPWTETVLYRFAGNPDGAVPDSEVVFDAVGNMYGTTLVGGTGGGTVFQMTPSNGGWKESVLHTFIGSDNGDGSRPMGGVLLDKAGNLYGTTQYGGTGQQAYGTLYQLTPTGGGWMENILYNFDFSGSGGYFPFAGLTSDNSGHLYGATTQGALNSGAVFQIPPSGGTLIQLYAFETNADCYQQMQWSCYGPYDSLTMGPDGSLYGTTHSVGAYALGNVFKLTFSQGSWVYTSLHDFVGSDGAYPNGPLVFDKNGNLYGTTEEGGPNGPPCTGSPGGCGVIFEITP